MNYPKLIECLKLFSQDSLRQYLGEDLVEQLLSEWENNGPLTKKRLAEMIIQLNGIELLKKANFRKDVLMHMEARDIEAIFDTLPTAKKSGCSTLAEKANAIASLSWGPSDTNRKLLEILGVDSAIFTPVSEDNTAVVSHQAGKRFYELLDYQFIIKQRVLNELNRPYPLKRMLVHMPTGTGKTKTAMHTLVHYYNFTLKKQGTVIWLAHTTELLQQAYETFTDVWEHLGDGQINGYVDFTKTALETIGKNQSRNKAILDKLRELSTEQVPTIVFACSVAHAKLLSFMLSLEDIPNALVLGEMNSVDRTEAITSFKDRQNPVNILINYEVLTTGFDSTNIRCVFITRPTQSIVLYSQMLGRGLRGPMMGGNEECLLVDIKDNLGRYDADMAFSHFDAYWS